MTQAFEDPSRSSGHDVLAVRADRPLYAQLYRLTTEVAERSLRNVLARVTASGAAGLFRDEFDTLRRFLDESRAEQVEPDESNVRRGDTVQQELIGGLEAYLNDSLEDSASDEDGELAHDLAEEFSRVLWSSLLRHMRLHSHGGRVEPSALLPLPGERIDGDYREMLLWVSKQFGMGEADAQAILHNSLAALLRDSPERAIPFPLGLSVERGPLVERIDAWSPRAVRPADKSAAWLEQKHLMR